MKLDNYSIAIAHEHYRDRGGGEHVAEHLARIFDAPIYTGMIRDGSLPDKDIEINPIFSGVTSSLMDKSTFLRDFCYFLGWEYCPELSEYDIIIQSGNNPGWYVPEDDQVVIRYGHTTPRAAYDQFQEKGDSILIRGYSKAARLFYSTVKNFPDAYVANSELVGYRHESYMGIDVRDVIYPPVPVDTFGPQETEDFYLTYSRLTWNKNIGEIIQAFQDHPNKDLKVGGDGEMRDELEEMAAGHDNIEFLGYMDEDEKRDMCARAKGLVYAANNEDFGMVPIEALASGTPVIGVNDGYTKMQIDDGQNGILFDRGELGSALTRFENIDLGMSQDEIMQDVEQYSVDVFESKMRQLVDDVVEEVPTV